MCVCVCVCVCLCDCERESRVSMGERVAGISHTGSVDVYKRHKQTNVGTDTVLTTCLQLWPLTPVITVCLNLYRNVIPSMLLLTQLQL